MKLANTFKKTFIATLLATSILPAIAHEAHVHGIAKLDVEVDNQKLSLHLDTPLANLVGFEHAPKKEKDKLALKKAVTALRDAASLFHATPSAECKPVSTTLQSAVIEEMNAKHAHKQAQGHEHKDGHADLEAEYAFVCAHPENLHTIDVQLFKAFKGFEQIDVQLISPKGQSAHKLNAKQTKIQW